MKNKIFTVYVEKKPNFNNEALALKKELEQLLGIKKMEKVRVINKYDIEKISEEEYEVIKSAILSEVNVDNVYDKFIDLGECKYFAVEYLPGQYDQRADSAAQCIQLMTQKQMPVVKTSKVIAIYGHVNSEDIARIKAYYINSVDSRETSLEKTNDSAKGNLEVTEIDVIDNFIKKNEDELQNFIMDNGLSITLEDVKLIQRYFSDEEHRNPTITEIKVIDTYWSDHCRHTTFLTSLENIEIQNGKLNNPVNKAFSIYMNYRNNLYKNKEKPISLMDIAVIGMKKLREEGKLKSLDLSEEINACSILVDVDVDGKIEKYVVMFKNETHNHPTEIEPFGGAATCIGGAIRDPLSGRSYVYQAMRITGSGDPRTPIEETLKGKLPQRKISKEAARGYSSYGNQIGLATGYVKEIYHQGYVAKRMEVGAVIGAAPYENIVRSTPIPGDLIILLGGRTGRDGIGGAAGSSKEHTEVSINTCNAEVQKGNAPTERKIQRLFRKKEVTQLIKKCNDFGAGGVSVAIGELAEGIRINLDLVPKKYEGLDGTEIAISESQERMAVVVSPSDGKAFINLAMEENLEATIVARVTEEERVVMEWRGNSIVNLSRKFLNTNGAQSFNDIFVEKPKEENNYFNKRDKSSGSVYEEFKKVLNDLNVASQKGLVEMFDSSIGGGTVLMPFGGKTQSTPLEAMVCKIPLTNGETTTGTIMAYGFNPEISTWSTFHGAVFAVVESITKVIATGGSLENTYLTFQEYFERLGNDPVKWGKPFSSLLGALYAQHNLGVAAIGGKDSMSGTFKDLKVPPTLISFAVSTANVEKVISGEFKKVNSNIVLIPSKLDDEYMIDFSHLKKNFKIISELIEKDLVSASHTITHGGIFEAIAKMAFGNEIGIKFKEGVTLEEVGSYTYGSVILELKDEKALEILKESDYSLLGTTINDKVIIYKQEVCNLTELKKYYDEPLNSVFPVDYNSSQKYQLGLYDEHFDVFEHDYISGELNTKESAKNQTWIKSKANSLIIESIKPKVLIPIFPGTNCEFDCERAFVNAGAKANPLVFNNLTPELIEDSILELEKKIKTSQIIMLPGGFSAGDEPDGSGKFISAIFRNSRIKEAVMDLLKNRDGLVLGICNGFQALIKLGLVTYGEIRDLDENSPTLIHNAIGRHVSTIVNTKIVTNKSPWLQEVQVGDIHTIPISHGEGRFYGSEEVIKTLLKNNQIATQYVDLSGNPTYDIKFNPNGSMYAIEGITSPDGRVFGKMGHSERFGKNVFKNVIGNYDQRIFESGVNYYK
ncbi:phosphoribosylformylglycinamidine synthase [Clostridium sp.]|uniref:phosphoribosylformylglycinamidine synthase n=1 Tax=Clostridium sp. TaxID=1506 RepID=UPI002FC62C9B